LVYFGQTGRIITETLWSLGFSRPLILCVQLSSSPFLFFLQLLSPSHLNPISVASRASPSRATSPESFNSWAQKHDDRQQRVKWKTVSFKLIRGIQRSFTEETVEGISDLLTWYAKRMMPTSISDMVTIMKITFDADKMILTRVWMSNLIYKDEIPKFSKRRCSRLDNWVKDSLSWMKLPMTWKLRWQAQGWMIKYINGTTKHMSNYGKAKIQARTSTLIPWKVILKLHTRPLEKIWCVMW